MWNDGPSNATGGGFSNTFARPAYQQQQGSAQPGRGVPDIAGNADPASGYRVRVDGFNFVALHALGG